MGEVQHILCCLKPGGPTLVPEAGQIGQGLVQIAQVFLDLGEDPYGREREALHVSKDHLLFLFAPATLGTLLPLGFSAEARPQGLVSQATSQLLIGVQQLTDGRRVAQAKPRGPVSWRGSGHNGPCTEHLEKTESKKGG